MNRFQAFLIHLGISLSIFGVLAYLVVDVWYPDFFFHTDGGWQGLRLLLGVDLVLGPMLTLIVYRAGKPGLRFDLTVIGAVQLVCLAAGVWIVYGERPLAVVYSDGSFYTVTGQSFREIEVPVPNLDGVPGRYPKWVTVKLPRNPEEQSAIRGQMLENGRMLATLSDHYAPFNKDDLLEGDARSPEEISDRDRDSEALEPWLAKHGGDIGDYSFYLFGARYAYCYLGFDRKTGQFAGVLSVPAPN